MEAAIANKADIETLSEWVQDLPYAPRAELLNRAMTAVNEYLIRSPDIIRYHNINPANDRNLPEMALAAAIHCGHDDKRSDFVFLASMVLLLEARSDPATCDLLRGIGYICRLLRWQIIGAAMIGKHDEFNNYLVRIYCNRQWTAGFQQLTHSAHDLIQDATDGEGQEGSTDGDLEIDLHSDFADFSEGVDGDRIDPEELCGVDMGGARDVLCRL